jgi:hypothetical protein
LLGVYFGRGDELAPILASADVLRPTWVALALAAALAISILGVWIPAMLAARTDPAMILREGDR